MDRFWDSKRTILRTYHPTASHSRGITLRALCLIRRHVLRRSRARNWPRPRQFPIRPTVPRPRSEARRPHRRSGNGPSRRAWRRPAPKRRRPVPNSGLPEPIEFPGNELTLTISRPPDVLVSESVTFQIIIRNPLPRVVEDVVIECRFGDGLAFPGSDEQALRQQLGTLGSAEFRTIDLSLTAERAGTHCVEFLGNRQGH